MAENIYNITLPDGTTVSLPAWATDETLRRLVAETSASKKLDEKLLKVLSGIVHETGSIDNILRDLKNTTQRETKKREILDRKTQKSVGRFTTSAIRAAKGMGDTSKPLSSSLDMMKGSIETLFKDMDSGSTKTGKSLSRHASKTMKMYSAFGKATGLAVSAILGLNAKKFEQFEESQKRMIDAGAAFLENDTAFHDLYKKSIQAGVSYDTFTQLVQQSGTALLSLGDGVSSGQVRFLSMFKDLNDGADKFGDFGLRSADMMQEFAEYVEMERLKGTVGDAKTEAGQKKLRDGFADLMFETTALANLTGIKSKEQRAALRDALQDDHYAVMLGKMTDEQQTSANRVTEIYGTKKDKNPLAKLFYDFNQQLVKHGGDTDRAYSVLVTQKYSSGSFKDGAAIQLLSQMKEGGYIDRIKDNGATGTVEAFTDFLKNNKDRLQLGTAGAGVAHETNILFAHGDQLLKQTAKLTELTLDELGKTKGLDTPDTEGIGQKLGQSGSIVATMNNFEIMLNELQEKVLMPLDKTAESLYSLSGALRMFVDVALSASIKSRFKEYSIPVLAGNDEVIAHLKRIEKITELGYKRSDVNVVKTDDDEWKVEIAEGAKKVFKTFDELMSMKHKGASLTSRQEQRINDAVEATEFIGNINDTIEINRKMKEGIPDAETSIPKEKNTESTVASTSEASETGLRTAADDMLQDNIDADATIARTSEGVLQGNIDSTNASATIARTAEKTDNEAAITALQTAMTVTAAANATAITAEAARATDAEAAMDEAYSAADSLLHTSDSTTPNVAITKLITDHQSTTLQNHKSMLSLTEELKITVANMKQVAMDRSNSTRSI
jgi:hypothetical protein